MYGIDHGWQTGLKIGGDFVIHTSSERLRRPPSPTGEGSKNSSMQKVKIRMKKSRRKRTVGDACPYKA